MDRWISLDVRSDETEGLRQNGEIVLYKGLDGEIKEAKLKDIFSATGRVAIKNAAIAEIKNRWVRVSLRTKLTGDLFRKLPALDTILLKTAPAEPVQPDRLLQPVHVRPPCAHRVLLGLG